jgi:hypothetical protein
MEFWRITAPDYDEGDYSDAYINGHLTHPFGMPGVICDVCGQTWSGSRVLPYSCPASLRKEKHLREPWPIPIYEHIALQDQVRSALKVDGIHVDLICPGDDFQPSYLDIPSVPEFDFLWAGLGSTVVSQRVADLVQSLGCDDIIFCPVAFRKVGTGRANDVPPIPEGGEPEGIINVVSLLDSKDDVDSYYEMIVQAESDDPPGANRSAPCCGCGREAIDSKNRRLVMTESMWQGHDMFVLATTLNVLVTTKLRGAFEDHQFTNIAFKQYPNA